MLLSLLALDTRPVWYGPLTATFEIQVPGNPYDPDQNDLKVKFIPEKGNSEERLAYADTKAHEFPPRRNGVYPV